MSIQYLQTSPQDKQFSDKTIRNFQTLFSAYKDLTIKISKLEAASRKLNSTTVPEGTTNHLLKFIDGPHGVVGDSDICNVGGKIGIGTEEPSTLIDIRSEFDTKILVTNDFLGSAGLTIGCDRRGSYLKYSYGRFELRDHYSFDTDGVWFSKYYDDIDLGYKDHPDVCMVHVYGKTEFNGTVKFNDLTANNAVCLNNNNELVSVNVTLTEFECLTGVTSSIQTQINGKEDSIALGTASQYWRGDKTWQTLNTAAIPEETNLYYTNTRADARISMQKGIANGLATLDSNGKIPVNQLPNSIINGKEDSIALGTASQYWRGDKTWQTLNTAAIPEETNLYYTNTRADARISMQKGIANGLATLDSNGKIPVNQLPNSIMEYKGTYNASINTPSLSDGTGNQGDIYRVSVAGTRNFGSGNITFDVGDYCIYNGSTWEKSDTTDAVASLEGSDGVTVSSATGNITISIADGALSIAKTSGLQSALNNRQPLDGDLTAIAGLSGASGLLRKNAANTWALDTNTYLTSVSWEQVQNRPNDFIRKNGNVFYQLDTWLQSTGNYGLYFPNSGSGTHFYPNTTKTYGSFIIEGSKGSAADQQYQGFIFGSTLNSPTLMLRTRDGLGGIYCQDNGKWQWHYDPYIDNLRIGANSYPVNHSGIPIVHSTQQNIDLSSSSVWITPSKPVYRITAGSNTYKLWLQSGSPVVNGQRVVIMRTFGLGPISCFVHDAQSNHDYNIAGSDFAVFGTAAVEFIYDSAIGWVPLIPPTKI
jgi:hypothetical protein